MRARHFTPFIFLFLIWLPQGHSAERPYAFSFFAGPGTPTPLVDLVRVRDLELTSDWIAVSALSRTLWTDQRYFTTEAEAQLAHHLTQWDDLAVNAALLLRWLQTPWGATSREGRFTGTFAFGSGVSYAARIPALETDYIGKSSKLLFHLLMEFTFPLDQEAGLEGIFRLHHRSGVFGLIRDVVGGSDFLCFGVKYRF